MIRYSSYSRANYKQGPSNTTDGLSAHFEEGWSHRPEDRTNDASTAPFTAATTNNRASRADAQTSVKLACGHDDETGTACVASLIDPLELQYRELQELRERVRAAELAAGGHTRERKIGG
jgi:hypothetical protein